MRPPTPDSLPSSAEEGGLRGKGLLSERVLLRTVPLSAAAAGVVGLGTTPCTGSEYDTEDTGLSRPSRLVPL